MKGPGLYLEGTKVLEMLTSKDGSGPAFDVVVPSLPNFGFSSAVQKKGFGIKKYAEVCHKLMISLGYDEYGTTLPLFLNTSLSLYQISFRLIVHLLQSPMAAIGVISSLG